jgi:hypothetical protein
MQYSKKIEMGLLQFQLEDVFLSRFVTALRKPTKNLS